MDGQKTIAEVEINTDARRPEMYRLLGKEFRRKPLDIPQPQTMLASPTSSSSREKSSQAAIPYSQRAAATNEVCEKVTDMIKRLGSPIQSPINPHDIKEGKFRFMAGDLKATIILSNGYRFSYGRGIVTSFYSPNSDTREGADISTIYGKVHYTKQQVLDFAESQVRKLGYPDEIVFLDQPAFVGGGPDNLHPGYARFRVSWKRPGTRSIDQDPNAQFTEAEVNGITLQLESLWLRNTNLSKRNLSIPDGGRTNRGK
jgi:hypothetical protein